MLAAHDALPLGAHRLSLQQVADVARGPVLPTLSEEGTLKMERSCGWVRKVLHERRPIYGVSTGFGSLASTFIEPEQSAALSRNLIRSHAAGVGKACPTDVVRATMLLRANALAQGASGCRPELVRTLLAMLEKGVHPVIPQQGSCGSSGDLAPLSHLGLVLFGEGGEAEYQGQLHTGPEAMAKAGIPTLETQAKDGLAMSNGAQLTTAISVLAWIDAAKLLHTAELAAAMSIEALRGVTRAFHPSVHALRPYTGALACAARLRALLAGSSLVDSTPKVQDAYSLRCTPVVLGSVRDFLDFTGRQLAVEVNAVTDNPVFVDEGDDLGAFSAGLFHGEPVGMAADALKLAVAELGSLSERRLYRLTTGSLSQRLPPALVGQDRPDLGMIVPQTAAAALVSENKALCWPASADSIPTCEDQEDHVAMSTTAAWRLREVVQNSRRVVAVELLCAARALHFRQQEDPSVRLGVGAAWAMERLAKLPEEGVASEQIEAIARLIEEGLEGPCA